MIQESGTSKCVMYTHIPTKAGCTRSGFAVLVFDEDNDRPVWWLSHGDGESFVPNSVNMYGVSGMRALPYFTKANVGISKQIFASIGDDLNQLWKFDEPKEAGSIDPGLNIALVCRALFAVVMCFHFFL